jgi:hypothetical protein
MECRRVALVTGCAVVLACAVIRHPPHPLEDLPLGVRYFASAAPPKRF